MWVREMKHAAMLQEWSGRIAECRSSGMAVKNWCKAQGIAIKTYYYWERQFVTEASRQGMLPGARQAGVLMRIDPQTMPSDNMPSKGKEDAEAGITIGHGESIITLPAGYTVESIADLVQALNRHV